MCAEDFGNGLNPGSATRRPICLYLFILFSPMRDTFTSAGRACRCDVISSRRRFTLVRWRLFVLLLLHFLLTSLSLPSFLPFWSGLIITVSLGICQLCGSSEALRVRDPVKRGEGGRMTGPEPSFNGFFFFIGRWEVVMDPCVLL